jgi:hypothetical protein
LLASLVDPEPPFLSRTIPRHASALAAASQTPPFVLNTDLLERLFVEERRLQIIPNRFSEKPVLKLMFGALIRAAERWRVCASPSLWVKSRPR